MSKSLHAARRQALGVDVFDSELTDAAARAADRWSSLRSADLEEYGATLQRLRSTRAPLATAGLSREAVHAVSAMLVTFVRQGTPATRASELVSASTGVAPAVAKLMALDGMRFVNAAVSRNRQEGAGVKRYTWRATADDRTSAEHMLRNGCIYEWGDIAPPGGHPGEEPGCRCTADPVLPTWEELERQVSEQPLETKKSGFLRGFISGLLGKV